MLPQGRCTVTIQWRQFLLFFLLDCISLASADAICSSRCCSTCQVTFDRHSHPFNDPLSGTTRVSRYQKGKTNLDFTEARDSECQWHQLGHMQVCTSLRTDNHASTPPLCFLQAGCLSCRPANSVKALKASSGSHTEASSDLRRRS